MSNTTDSKPNRVLEWMSNNAKPTVFIFFIGGCLLIGIPISIVQANQHENTDPRLGWVTVDSSDNHFVQKKCDGSTLMYSTNGHSGSISTVANSPECK